MTFFPKRIAPALAAVLALMGAVAIAARAEAATIRLFAYDPANEETRQVAGPLTFEFRQQLVFTTLLRIRSTEAAATAQVIPADEKVLGSGGLSAFIGPNAPERDFFEVTDAQEGNAMIAAFCPGSKHAWVSLGRLKMNRDLRVHVFGDGPEPGKVHLCHTFNFYYHGEWKAKDPYRVDPREVLKPHFPY